MDTYRKMFFWIFILLGILYGIYHQPLIDNFLDRADSQVKELLDNKNPFVKPTKLQDSLFQMLIKLVLFIVISIIMIILKIILYFIYYALFPLFHFLNQIYVTCALLGAIFIYPFYFIFINLFETILLLSIRHPSISQVRSIIGRRRIDNETIMSISQKMMTFSGRLPHEIESQIMTRQVKGLTKLIYAETNAVRKLREKRIKEGLRNIKNMEDHHVIF